MTRERIPPGTTLQRAYGVLDKYQMSRTFFIKTEQKGCDPEPPAFEAYDPTEPTTTKGSTAFSLAPAKKKKKPLNAVKTVDQTIDEQISIPNMDKVLQSTNNTNDT